MAERSQPHIVAIAGPNGAGKSTFARGAISRIGISSYVNADVIAQGLAGLHTESVAIEAGRIMLERLRELARQRANFAFETTLSARSLAPWIDGLRQSGYAFELVFVTLRDPDLAVERVNFRVALGGHHVPEGDVRRRFHRAIRNFFDLYQPLADRWSVFDNSFATMQPLLVAMGAGRSRLDIIDSELWSRFRSQSNAAP